MNPRRGDIWWVDLNPTRGSEINKERPCVVLSIDVFNDRRKTVIVVPLSTSPTVRPPLTVGISSAGRPSVAVIDQIRATAKERFGGRIGTVSGPELESIEDAVREVLGIF
jgi:mRNA interferase MazF